ncbi:hypothetical protein L1987_63051 [Smallanthus sonchifolius]|uniref:Uncharacterized protein n=1 Tax=Smallanthus sonchifolius TaxID=185202 RepID=A0ACB9CC70_9ASTR|nr:hypothetical protein L1987_63051 [Smallanthus sonchifolius]
MILVVQKTCLVGMSFWYPVPVPVPVPYGYGTDLIPSVCVIGSLNQSGPANMGYGMYSNPGGPSSNGSTIYPYEHSTGFASHTEPLQFGSLAQAGFSGVNGPARLNDGSHARGAFEEHRFPGASVRQRSSPDRPSSSYHQR